MAVTAALVTAVGAIVAALIVSVGTVFASAIPHMLKLL